MEWVNTSEEKILKKIMARECVKTLQWDKQGTLDNKEVGMEDSKWNTEDGKSI
jgi:hypothetical protein